MRQVKILVSKQQDVFQITYGYIYFVIKNTSLGFQDVSKCFLMLVSVKIFEQNCVSLMLMNYVSYDCTVCKMCRACINNKI